MRSEPKSAGWQVQLKHEQAASQASYTDKMRVKIDSSAGRRQYSKRLGTIGR